MTEHQIKVPSTSEAKITILNEFDQEIFVLEIGKEHDEVEKRGEWDEISFTLVKAVLTTTSPRTGGPATVTLPSYA